MGWLDDLFGSSGYDDAMDQLTKAHQQAMGYLQPYEQFGEGAGKALSGAASQLMNPEALESKWISDYHESPFAKQQQALAQQQGMSAASSMGLEGSSPALQAIQQGTTNIGLADRQQYLHDLMNKYLAGVNVNQGLYGTGANVAGRMAQMQDAYGNQMANLQYGSDQSSPLGALGQLAGGIFGAMGGPIGSAVGSKVGNWIGKIL